MRAICFRGDEVAATLKPARGYRHLEQPAGAAPVLHLRTHGVPDGFTVRDFNPGALSPDPLVDSAMKRRKPSANVVSRIPSERVGGKRDG